MIFYIPSEWHEKYFLNGVFPEKSAEIVSRTPSANRTAAFGTFFQVKHL